MSWSQRRGIHGFMRPYEAGGEVLPALDPDWRVKGPGATRAEVSSTLDHDHIDAFLAD